MNLQKSSQSGNFIAGAQVASAVGSRVANAMVPHTFIRRVEADGVNIFYRDAGLQGAPAVLLLHGRSSYWPSSLHSPSGISSSTLRSLTVSH